MKSFPVPVTTLRALCREHARAEIDFLKIDVEGAEQAVLEGNDWARCRPKIDRRRGARADHASSRRGTTGNRS